MSETKKKKETSEVQTPEERVPGHVHDEVKDPVDDVPRVEVSPEYCDYSNILDVYNKDPEKSYRWIRKADGQVDRRKAMGYQETRDDNVKTNVHALSAGDSKIRETHAEILMELPKKVADARMAANAKKSRDRINAVKERALENADGAGSDRISTFGRMETSR